MRTIAGTDPEEAGTVTMVDCTLVLVSAGTVEETVGSSSVEGEATADEEVGCSSTEIEVVEAICCPSVERWGGKRLVSTPTASVGRVYPLGKVT